MNTSLNSDKERIAILGAGVAGLCMAKHLSAVPGTSIDVFEKSDRAGGLLHSEEVDGLHFDVGTFLFIEGHGLVETFPFLKPDFVPIQYRPKSITPSLSLDVYPFTLKRFLKDNGILVTVRGLLDLLASKVLHRGYHSVEGFANYYIGNTIYKRSGLQKYIHRLHDLADKEIDIEFAESRLKALSAQSFRKQIQNGFRRLKNKISGKRTLSLKDRFVRPKYGLPRVFDQIQTHLKEQGVRIHLNSSVHGVSRAGEKFRVETDDGVAEYDRVICTIPIPVMLRLVGQTPGESVSTRSLISLFYRGRLNGDVPVFFNFSDSGRWKRITVFSKFYGDVDGDDYFTVEITTDNGSEDDVEEAKRDFENHIAGTNLLTSPPTLLGHYVTQNAYPIYRSGQMQGVRKEKQKLTDFGIDFVGRQGNFEYVISHFIAKNAQAKAEEIAPQLMSTES